MNRFLLIILTFLIVTFAATAGKKQEYEKEKITDYTLEEIKELFVQMGKKRPPLGDDDAVYFELLKKDKTTINTEENKSSEMTQLGMVTIELKKRVKSDTAIPWDPNSTDYFVFLKPFAKSIGANVIKVATWSTEIDTRGRGMTWIIKITFEFGYKAED